MTATLLLVDDHPLFRDGFASMLRELRPAWGLRLAASAGEGCAVLGGAPVDLVIVDIQLPDRDGFEAVGEMAQLRPMVPRVLISGREDAAARQRARHCGANGFIAKSASPEAIVAALDGVLAGGLAFDAPGAAKIPVLTERQIEVLGLLSEGHGNKEIRYRLGIAERTVRAHLTELFHALGAHSRVQAILRARELGLI